MAAKENGTAHTASVFQTGKSEYELSSLRKPRSDSKLDALNVDQQRQLCEWLLTSGLTYEKIKGLVLDEFGTSTSTRALSVFYQSYVVPNLIRRRAQGVSKELSEDFPRESSEATLHALELKASEMVSNPFLDPKSLASIFTLLLGARDRRLKQQDIIEKLCRLQLLEKNSEKAKEKLTMILNKGLTNETLQEIEAAAKLL